MLQVPLETLGAVNMFKTQQGFLPVDADDLGDR